jgi:hypothetical protein
LDAIASIAIDELRQRPRSEPPDTATYGQILTIYVRKHSSCGLLASWAACLAVPGDRCFTGHHGPAMTLAEPLQKELSGRCGDQHHHCHDDCRKNARSPGGAPTPDRRIPDLELPLASVDVTSLPMRTDPEDRLHHY